MADGKHLAALRTHWKRHSTFPAMPELCQVVGPASTSSVFAAVGRLTKAGYLGCVEGRIAPTRRFFARPMLGLVRAGLPQPVRQEEPEVLTLDDYLIGDPNRTSLHRVRGESMRDAGVFDGDLVVVEHQSPTKPGDSVVACVDDELTVKTLRLDTAGQHYLEAANPAFGPVHARTSPEILGVVISVVRRLRR